MTILFSRHLSHIPVSNASATTESARIKLIDIAKGIGILLVVMQHNTSFNQQLSAYNDLIGAICLPFFFFIAGVTFPANRHLRARAWSRADAWLKPCAVVVIALGLFRIFKGVSPFESILVSLSFGTGFALIWPPMWFLPHVWLLYVFSTLLLAALSGVLSTQRRQLLLCLVLGVIGYLILIQFDTALENPSCRALHEKFSADMLRCGLPFSADFLLLSSMFFLPGHFLTQQVRDFSFSYSKFIICLLLFSISYAIFQYRIDFNWRRYDDFFVTTLQAFSGIYVVLSFCYFLSRYKAVSALISYIGMASLFILIFHSPFQNKAAELIARFGGNAVLSGVGAYLISILISIGLWKACRSSRILGVLMLPVPRKKIPTVATKIPLDGAGAGKSER